MAVREPIFKGPLAVRLRERVRRLRERIVYRLEYVGITPETLTESQKMLMERFATAISGVLGVPREAIREDVLQRWVINWSKAFVREEFWRSMRAEVKEALGIK